MSPAPEIRCLLVLLRFSSENGSTSINRSTEQHGLLFWIGGGLEGAQDAEVVILHL